MIEWQRQEPGWYTSLSGGICEEYRGWWFYPRYRGFPSIDEAYGPYKTLDEAKRQAEFLTGGKHGKG